MVVLYYLLLRVHLQTYKMGQLTTVQSVNSYSLRPLDSNQKGGCVKSTCYSALKPDKLGLNCEANECSDTGTAWGPRCATHVRNTINEKSNGSTVG